MSKGGLTSKSTKGFSFKSYNSTKQKEMDEKMAKLRAARKGKGGRKNVNKNEIEEDKKKKHKRKTRKEQKS